MTSLYNYELWNGKEVLGHCSSMWPLYGMKLRVPELSTYKQPYNKKCVIIEVTIITRIVHETPTEILYRIVLDVRRKSKRQIEILKRGRKL